MAGNGTSGAAFAGTQRPAPQERRQRPATRPRVRGDRRRAPLAGTARSCRSRPCSRRSGLPRRDMQAPWSGPAHQAGAQAARPAAAAKELHARPGRRHRAGTDQGGAIRRRTAGAARARGPMRTRPPGPPPGRPARRRGSPGTGRRRPAGGQAPGQPGGPSRSGGPGRPRRRVAAARNGASPPRRPKAKAANDTANGTRALLPFAAPHPNSPPVTGDGRRNCGPLESFLWRQSAAAKSGRRHRRSPRSTGSAQFPGRCRRSSPPGSTAFTGHRGVPDLDDMAALHGVPLPSGKATWDACAGAYGDRKIVVGTRPSPTPDVICHEVGHALDDLDSPPGKWQSIRLSSGLYTISASHLSRVTSTASVAVSAGRSSSRLVRRDRVGAAARVGRHAER